MHSSQFEWKSRTRDYKYEKKKQQIKLEECNDHPLKPTVVTMSESSGRSLVKKMNSTTSNTTSSTSSSGPSTPLPRRSVSSFDPLNSALSTDINDPLSQFAKEEEELDPLSKMAADLSPDEKWDTGKGSEKRSNVDTAYDEAFSWSSKRSAILTRFTTSEKLSIMTSFLSGGDKVVSRAQATGPQTSAAVEKVRTRLEQLDDFEEGTVREEGDLTQGEYAARIEQLNSELTLAWNDDQKVKALKIAIQCSKLLADTSVIQFYPSKFVLITDILDSFGQLVYDRLKSIAETSTPGIRLKLPANFTPDMIPEAAKETCRNWFYKIASIRELVPRFYVETAILRSYSFLSSSEYSSSLVRLTKIIRGIGDPLVAIYARCYLCRVGLTITKDSSYVQDSLYDFLASHQQLYSRMVKADLARQQVDMSSYLILYTPALDWILPIANYPGTEMQLLNLLSRLQDFGVKSGLVLNSIMIAFKAMYISARASEFVDLITNCDNDGFPKYILFRTLGLCVVAAEPPKEQHLSLLNTVWKFVSKLHDTSHYMACAEIWIEFTIKYFTSKEVNAFLADIIKHITPNRAYQNHYGQLQSIVLTLLRHCQDIETLFAMDKFLPFIDLFKKDNVKVDACKSIMEGFCNKNQHGLLIHDPVTISGILYLCRILHDSVSALTIEDEKRQIGNLICGFVKSVDFGRDFEQQLSFYVDSRASFTNLDSVLVQLVQNVNRLAVDTRRIVSGHHTRKTAAFVRACAAYCFITIPSIESYTSRLELYLLSGQVSLMNQCLGQADSCFKAILNLLPEFPRQLEIDGKQKSSDQYLISFLCNFMSTLLIVPDIPGQDFVPLTKSLFNIIHDYQWEHKHSSQMNLYLNYLNLLSASSQELYSYHIERVESNDTLYGGHPKFIAKLYDMCNATVEEYLIHLKMLINSESPEIRSSFALELFYRILIMCDISHEPVANLCMKLWCLAHNKGHVDSRITEKMIKSLKARASLVYDSGYLNFIQSIQEKV